MRAMAESRWPRVTRPLIAEEINPATDTVHDRPYTKRTLARIINKQKNKPGHAPAPQELCQPEMLILARKRVDVVAHRSSRPCGKSAFN